jgi:hypothetical protein
MNKKVYLTLLLSVLLSAGIISYAQQENRGKLQFLIGEWIGTGGGTSSGEGGGGSTFRFDLDSSVIVRENYAHYPAQNNKPEYTHKDLMIIYYQSSSPRAIYFDNEKHVINYDIGFEENKILFTSEEVKGAPQFKLSYEKLGESNMKLYFDIAPPNTPGEFKTYLTAGMQRK